MLPSWHLVVEKVPEKDVKFAQLLHSSARSKTPSLQFRRRLKALRRFGWAQFCSKAEKHSGYGSCSWVLWRLPEWTIVAAAGAFLPSTSVIVAEYTGMNRGVLAALEIGVDELIVVGALGS
ncbi:hypothetical protein PC120_g7217 [Phytophthora cactorum]|nr:hypothetical protein PC120_g7217 [Phytophthora cactorum]